MLLSANAVFAIAAAVLGLLLGSFATALAHRIPAGIPWAFRRNGAERMPRSACPHCGRGLTIRDLVPVISWLVQKGRCRSCRTAIGWAYPAIELACALACCGLSLAWGPAWPTLPVLMTVPFLAALFIIDLRHFILPDILNGLLAALWLPFVLLQSVEAGGTLWPGSLADGAAGAVVFAGVAWGLGRIMKKILRRDALGMGDVKFFAVAGLWLGMAFFPAFLIVSGFLGVVLGVVYQLVTKGVYFPFGPALIGAFYILLTVKGAAL